MARAHLTPQGGPAFPQHPELLFTPSASAIGLLAFLPVCNPLILPLIHARGPITLLS